MSAATRAEYANMPSPFTRIRLPPQQQQVRRGSAPRPVPQATRSRLPGGPGAAEVIRAEETGYEGDEEMVGSDSPSDVSEDRTLPGSSDDGDLYIESGDRDTGLDGETLVNRWLVSSNPEPEDRQYMSWSDSSSDDDLQSEVSFESVIELPEDITLPRVTERRRRRILERRHSI